ncbi:MAG: hypothetical protein WCI91_02615 [Candidatus Nomurabacteria bacterium]
MENEEKKGCCENKDGVKCEHGMMNCCHNWKQCHMIRKIIMIIVLIIVFCLGTQWGEMKSERREGYRFGGRNMMNLDYGNRYNDIQQGSGTVTVEVKKDTETPSTPTTPVVPTPKQ